jgi:hypothetical protein
MKKIVVFLFLLISAIADAQYFQLTDIVERDRFGVESRFPVLVSKKNTKAAEKINTYLHFALLSKVYGKPDTNIFSYVFAPEEEFWGQSLFAYSVNKNDDQIFSITIAYDNTGSYTERIDEQYNFIAKTGEHVILSDFFTESSLMEIGSLVNKSCSSVISNYIKTIDQTSEEGAAQIEMYEYCLERFENNSSISETEFSIESTEMIFINERCSNHMMAALDELWVLEHAMSIASLLPFLNQNATDLFGKGKWKFSRSNAIYDKILSGKINKKLAITARIRFSEYDGNVKGVYWYDNQKNPIELIGGFNAENKLILTEIIDGFDAGTFSGVVSQGKYQGTWSSKNGKKSLPFVISIN